MPFDLSVNHLHIVSRAPGSPNDECTAADEDEDDGDGRGGGGGGCLVDEEFLPVVSSHSSSSHSPSPLGFRWRSRARPGSAAGGADRTSAWRIEARRARHRIDGDGGDDDDGPLLWDSGRVESPDGMPDVVHCDGDCATQLMSTSNVGAIVEWRVTAWDSSSTSSSSSSTASGRSSSTTSGWAKFAIGPSQSHVHEMGSDGEDGGNGDYDDDDGNGWTARWISHPVDVSSWSATDPGAFWSHSTEDRATACRNWEGRSQLPIFRAKLDLPGDGDHGGEISSALLVVSGLGSFRASFDGVPLSSSGPLDPPLTDFAQRVSYRGYDVTRFLINNKKKKKKTKNRKDKAKKGEKDEESRSAVDEHVVGISMGSGE
jgi:hypothetical protein